MNDWRVFLKEVQKQNKEQIEKSKQRDHQTYDDSDCDACKIEE